MGNLKTRLYRKKQRNSKKVSKSRQDPQYNEKNKASASASASPSVSEGNENSDSRDLETVAASKVTITHTYTQPKWIGPYHVSDSGGYYMRRWTTPKEIPTGSDGQTPRQTPPATNTCPSHDLETMAALGVSVVFTQKFPHREGPPVKNSAANPENWAALGNPDIH